MLSHPLAKPLDGPGGDVVPLRDLGTGQCGDAVGLSSGEKRERALDRLRVSAAACDECL